MVMVRGNGKDNVYTNPTSSPDPMLKTVKGRYAYGFNLDGKGAASPSGFEDPVTHEKGINNQWYRATGCIRSYRAVPPPAKPDIPETHWDILRNSMPAWLITITAVNGFGKDGDATVTIDRAVERVTARGQTSACSPT